MRKTDGQIVREALDRRLSGLEPSAARRARIRSHLEEEPVMKKKFTASLLAALIAALILAGAAMAVGLNLFDIFGRGDERLSRLAGEAALPTVEVRSVESQALGTTRAAIENAYYDGQSLIVAYSMKNNLRVEEFTPTREELAQAEALEGTVAIDAGCQEAQAVLSRFHQAQEDGEPFGIVQYLVYPSDHTATSDGIDLPPSSERTLQGEDGALVCLRECEFPLPEGAQDRDALEIRIELIQSASYLYFDGQTCYRLPGAQREAGAMTACVERNCGGVRRFLGEGAIGETTARVEAEFSPVYGWIELSTAARLADPGEGRWYALCVRDERGAQIRVRQQEQSEGRLEVLLEGTGALPERLRVELRLESEGAAQGETVASFELSRAE